LSLIASFAMMVVQTEFELEKQTEPKVPPWSWAGTELGVFVVADNADDDAVPLDDLLAWACKVYPRKDLLVVVEEAFLFDAVVLLDENDETEAAEEEEHASNVGPVTLATGHSVVVAYSVASGGTVA
jgi:hypothetical protein